ncbi:MAG: PcfJ domain-containing protein [Bacteroidales bacterium]|nr:PcfJ domain-containing protein [Bacteroidales bacterium]
MRPRTGVERRLLEESFAPLPEKTVEWAKSNLFSPRCVTFTRGRGKKKERVLWCLECGHIETVPESEYEETRDELVAAGWICPSCREVLKMGTMPGSSKRAEVSNRLLALEQRDEWQVFRCFIITKRRELGGELEYCAEELFRTFINAKGVEHIVSRRYSRGWSFLRWKDGGWMIGRHNGGATGYYFMEDVYDLRGIAIAPGGVLLPEMLRRGLSIPYLKTVRQDLAQTIRCVMKYPQAETLLKSGHGTLLKDIIMYGKSSRILKYWPSVKIALRHGYDCTGHGMWLDYLDGLEREGKDMRSPRYLCPADLKAEHDRQIERETARRRAEQRKKELALLGDDSEENQQLLQRIAPIMGVVVADGHISISPLQSVKDFYEEGETLHHCVFQNRYYAREDCIILGAKVDGCRTETIELNARTLEVVQCRGSHNGSSKFHDDILRLLAQNVEKFSPRRAVAAREERV